MKEVKLFRMESTSQGTLGALVIDGECLCWTLECPWKNNQKNISCIPTGHYIAERHLSPSKGMTFRIKEVPSRNEILFHSGNTVVDTEGCILLGSQVGFLTPNSRAVLNSQLTMSLFMSRFKGESEFSLTIKEVF